MTPAAVTREKWAKSWDFIFATLGCTIGLGNVWRFPYLCFKNGGGAFLLPYFIFVFTLGIPLVILETSIGQKLRKGLAKSWEEVPICKGIAIAQVVVVANFNISYPILLVWSLKYLVASFSPVLPWSTCNNTWNTENCVTPSALANRSTINASTVSSAKEYWAKEVLSSTNDVGNPGSLQIDLVIYLALIWIAIYFCTFRGIKWTAKVVYVTATLPFILIATIIVRGVMLEGAGKGLHFYIVPDVGKLLEMKVWVSAATQVLFSYATSCGVLATLGSYNDYHHNFWRDSFMIGFLNSIVSFASGIGVFSTLGFMAHYQNTTIDKVASAGPGLAFIAYPETLSLLPAPQLWSAIFFLTLIFLGFDSEFVSQEVLMAFLYDNFPALKRRRALVHAAVCAIMMLIGLSMVTEGGIYVFEMFNNYGSAGWGAFFVAFCQFVSIGWLYGFDRYWSEMLDMIGPKFGRLWLKITWMLLGPATCVCIVIYYISNVTPLTYQDYTYPLWAQVLCHLISLSSVSFIPGFAIYKIIVTWKRDGSISELFRAKTNEKKGAEMHPMVSVD